MLKNDELLQCMNLTERLAQFTTSDSPRSQKPLDRRRINWWITTYFRGSRLNFKIFLKTLNLTIRDFGDLLAFKAGKIPTNLEMLASIWPAKGQYNLPRTAAPNWIRFGFENLVEPLLSNFEGIVTKSVDSLKASGAQLDGNQLVLQLDQSLRRRLSRVVTPTFIVEANIFALRATAASEEEAYQAMQRECLKLEYQKYFWNKYPALWRMVSEIVGNALAATTETLERIGADDKKIRATFSIAPDEKISEIRWGAGDSHCGGRSVAIISYQSISIVYKPKSLAIDVQFNRFLHWFSEYAPTLGQYSSIILDCDGYGYRNFVEASPCASPDEVRAFYRRLGALTAISWLFGAHDLHHENLVAVGPYPCLIDLEAVYIRPLRLENPNRPGYNELYQIANQESLLGTGLLPFRIAGAQGIFDLSALGARPNQPSPFKSWVIANPGRGDLRLVNHTGIIPLQCNLPVLDGAHTNCADFETEIKEGYSEALLLLQKHAPQISEHWLQKISRQKLVVRHIARGTMEYERLLQDSAHPTICSNPVEVDLLFGGYLSAVSAASPRHCDLLQSEIHDLWRGDIPYFYTYPSDCDVFDAGGRRFSRHFRYSGIEAQYRRLARVEKYRNYHLSAISSAIESVRTPEPQYTSSHSIYGDVSGAPEDEFLGAAVEIAKLLTADVFEEEGCPFWHGLNALDEQNYGVRITSSLLYEGLSGIGIFLSALSRLTGDEELLRISSNILRHIQRLLHAACTDLRFGCGAYSGICGVIYADILISYFLGRDRFAYSDRLFSRLTKSVRDDRNFDLVSGASGLLLVASRYYHLTGSETSMIAAIAASDRLARTFEVMPSGVAWRTLSKHVLPSIGFAHGASGIAYSLAKWAELTNNGELMKLASNAFLYVDSQFDPDFLRWREPNHTADVCYWCYGASGIGLSRYSTMGLEYWDAHKDHLKEVHRAIMSHWVTGNNSLCHGNVGNADVLLSLGQASSAKEILEKVMAEKQRSNSWGCGLPSNGHTPGLMNGLAGIGYGFLRHASPEVLPSVLILELPQLRESPLRIA